MFFVANLLTPTPAVDLLSANLRTTLLAFGVAFAAGVVLTPAARWAGRKVGVLDHPDDYRKLHKQPIPLAGGYAVLAAFLVPTLTAYLWAGTSVSNVLHDKQDVLFPMILGALFAVIMGGVDDFRHLRARYKLLWQVLLAVGAFYAGFQIRAISLPLLGRLEFDWLSLPITIFWFVGCMNAINLLDGLDGLAAGVGLFACLTLCITSLLTNLFFPMLLAAALAGAILAFLLFNFNPASIFLGDCGTMVIGFLIATISLAGSAKAHTAVALAIPFVALGLPVFDSTLAIFRRWSKRLPIAAPDRGHVHHKLLGLGLSQKKAVLVLYSICVALGAVALMISAGKNMLALVLLGSLVIIALVFVKVLGILRFSDLGQRIRHDWAERKRSEFAAVEVEKAVVAIEKADNLEDIWLALHTAFLALELDHAQLVIEVDDDAPTYAWERRGHHEDENGDEVYSTNTGYLWCLSLKIHHDGCKYGNLEVWKEAEELPIKNATYLINRVRTTLGKRFTEIIGSEAILSSRGDAANEEQEGSQKEAKEAKA